MKHNNINTIERVEQILCKYLETHQRFNTVEPCLYKNGVPYTVKKIIEEVKNRTDFGIQLVDGIISTTIGVLCRDAEKNINNNTIK